MSSEESSPVELYIYDLTHGIASMLSPAILGRKIEGVWHTSVVVYGREYFFGGGGVSSCQPGSTSLGAPLQREALGETFVPFQLFVDYLHGLASTTYTGAMYNLLEHNCNHFSDEVLQFLCGGRVPKHILELPSTALDPPLRAALATLLQQLHRTQQSVYAEGRSGRADSPDFLTLNHQIEQARVESAELDKRRSTLAEKLARKERRKEKKRRKQQGDAGEPCEMAEAQVEAAAGPSVRATEEDAPRTHSIPPILFNGMDGAAEFEKLSEALKDVSLSEAEAVSLEELRQYLVLGEGCWVLGDDFLCFVDRLLQDADVPVGARVALLRSIAACGCRDDVSLLLHGDRKTHALLRYAADVERAHMDERRACALAICNLFEQVSGAEWLLYISEWEHAGRPLCNMRASTKLCVGALLADDEALQDLGSAILYNIASRDVKTVVFDDVSVELGSAALQFLSEPRQEELVWRVCCALARLLPHAHDLPALAQMLGLDVHAYRGTSPRVDEQLDIIKQKIKPLN